MSIYKGALLPRLLMVTLSLITSVCAARDIVAADAVQIGRIWVNGSTGMVRFDAQAESGGAPVPPLSTCLVQKEYGRFQFTGVSAAGKKLFTLLTSAKINKVPITIWYAEAEDCNSVTGDVADLVHAGLLDAAQ